MSAIKLIVGLLIRVNVMRSPGIMRVNGLLIYSFLLLLGKLNTLFMHELPRKIVYLPFPPPI